MSTDKDILERYNATSKNTLMENLGIVYTLIEKGRVEAEMPVNNRNCQPFGFLHGGATLSIAETIAGVGSLVYCNDNQLVVGMQISGSHVWSAPVGDTVHAVATIIHKGHKTDVWNVDVFTSSNKLVSTVRVTNSIIEKRQNGQ